MKHPTRRIQLAPGFTVEEAAAIQELVREAGFRDVRTVRHALGREITGVLAHR